MMSHSISMEHTKALTESYRREELISHFALRVGRGSDVLGEIYSDGVDARTLFDMASVTKMIVTTTLTLIAADEGALRIRDKVSRYFRVPECYSDLEVFHLLTHTMGVGHRDLTKHHFTYATIAEDILSLPPECEVGREVRYSCPVFLLLGKLLEKIYGKSLDILFRDKVADPLGMRSGGFCPDTGRYSIVNGNLRDCDLGIVNDYNCRYLGGVGGNAGLFSDVEDVTRYVQMLLQDGGALLSRDILERAVRNYTPGMSESRGLGFLYVDGNYSQTGGLFPVGSVGHCGHTGTSVFLHRESGLYAIILTDATISTVKKYGRKDYDRVMTMRGDLHRAIREDLRAHSLL